MTYLITVTPAAVTLLTFSACHDNIIDKSSNVSHLHNKVGKRWMCILNKVKSVYHL